MSSKKNGTLYVGFTSDLVRRVWQHKQNVNDGFTKKHAIHHLVYFEQFKDAMTAINREKRLKFWKRRWKVELIEKSNPYWLDLYPTII